MESEFTEGTKPLPRGVTFSDGFTNKYSEEEIMELEKSLIPPERVQVDLRNVTVSSESRAQTREFNTVFQSLFSWVSMFTTKKERVDILSNITTSFTPGSLCVVIGPPQCGKS